MNYPLATLAPTINSAGISAPLYEDVYLSLIASFKSIYGDDIYITPDSQDGQWLAVLAQAIHESNQSAITCFLAFSPTYAQGAPLSSLVKLNGIARKSSSHSTAQGTVTGTVGTIISGGIVQDADNKLWSLPSPVTIPVGGSLSLTVTAQKEGSISATIGSITKIFNPQYGWQTFTNTSAAVVGAAVETDAALRTRQGQSVAIPALTIKGAITAAVANVAGVTRYITYENDTGSTDTNGIPAHSLSVVVLGGVSTDIAAAIALRKTPGAQTYGSTSVTVYDRYGLASTMNYFIMALVPIYFAVTIKALPGYVATTGAAIQQALADFVNGLDIGEDVYIAQASGVASLITLGIGQTFYITDIRQGLAASPTGTTNLVIAFNAAASCAVGNVGMTVT